MSNQDRFPPELLKKPWEERLEYFCEQKIPHQRMKQVSAEIKSAIRRRAYNGFIFVVGPTRIGKTTVLEHIVSEMLEETMDEMLEDLGCIPVAWMEIASYPRGYDWKDHWVGGLEALSEPLIEYKTQQGEVDFNNEHGTRAFIRESRTGRILRRAFEKAAKHRKLRVFCIDEAQHLTLVPYSRMYRAQLEIIKSVASRSRAMHVLFGTYDLLKLRNASGQLGSRAVTVHFNRYRPDSAADLSAFADTVLSLTSYMPLRERPDLKQDMDYCFETSLGCIGLLKVWLTDALGAVLESGRKTLTRHDLEKHEPPIDVLDKISAEIVEGERELESNYGKRSLIKLRMLEGGKCEERELSQPSDAGRQHLLAGDSGEASQSNASELLITQGRDKRSKKIERKPKRDKVGRGRKKRAA
jgi:hypothetical protein